MKRKMSLILSLVLVVNLFAGVNIVIADTITEAPVNVGRSFTKSSVQLDDTLIIDYSVKPMSIPVNQIENSQIRDKEIVIVYDKSGSMKDDLDGNTRQYHASNSANAFIEHVETLDNVKVGLVTYSSEASIFEYNNDDLLSSKNSSAMSALMDEINKTPEGGTNIGDAIRRAKEILDNGVDADKHIIFLTDGEPTAFSYTSLGSYSTWYEPYIIGAKVENGYETVVKQIWSPTYKTDNGDTSKYFVNHFTYYNHEPDYGNFSLNYAKTMAGILKQGVNVAGNVLPIEGHYIAFNNNDATNKLSEIAAMHTSEPVKSTSDPTVLQNIYTSLADEITSQMTLSDVYFQEKLPEGLEFVSGENGVYVDNGYLKGALPDIVYQLNDEKTAYVPKNNIEFSVTLKVTSVENNYLFAMDDTSFVRYTDIDNEPTYKTFNSKAVYGVYDFDDTPYIKEVVITPDKTTLYQEETVNVEYLLNGNEVTINGSSSLATQEKDVLLLIDTSNSMYWDLAKTKTVNVPTEEQRIDIARKAAVQFVNNFAGENMNIGIVNFSDLGYVQKFDGETFVSLSDLNNVTTVTDRINDLGTNGKNGSSINDLRLGTNMGDAFRDAYYEFINANNDHSKYIVFLSDGAPYYWMSQGIGSTEFDLDEIPNKLITAKTYEGVTRGTGSYNYTMEAIKQISRDTDLDVKQFMISISSRSGDRTNVNNFGIAANSLPVDHNGTTKYYYAADTPEDIMDTYNAIQDMIDSELVLENVSFTHEVPERMEPVEEQMPDGFAYNASTRTITGTIDITLIEQENGKYLMTSKSINIPYTFTSSKDTGFELDSVSLSYKDFAGNDVDVTDSNDPAFKILPTIPTIDPVTGDDRISDAEIGAVVTTGSTVADEEVVVNYIDKNNKSLATSATANDDGDYTTPSKDLDSLSRGEITVEAIVTDDDGDVSKGTRVAEILPLTSGTSYDFVDNVVITADKSEILAGEDIVLTFTMTGGAKTVHSSWNASSYKLEDVLLKYSYASNLTQSGTLNIVVPDIEVNKQADGTYKMTDTVVTATITSASTMDISIAAGSVDSVTYKTSKDNAIHKLESVGNSLAINVLPHAPVIDSISGDDYIFLHELNAVPIEGHVYIYNSGIVVDLTVTYPNSNVINLNGINVNADGTFVTPDQNMTTMYSGQVIIDSKSTDSEGDMNTGYDDDGKIIIELPDNI